MIMVVLTFWERDLIYNDVRYMLGVTLKTNFGRKRKMKFRGKSEGDEFRQ